MKGKNAILILYVGMSLSLLLPVRGKAYIHKGQTPP